MQHAKIHPGHERSAQAIAMKALRYYYQDEPNMAIGHPLPYCVKQALGSCNNRAFYKKIYTIADKVRNQQPPRSSRRKESPIKLVVIRDEEMAVSPGDVEEILTEARKRQLSGDMQSVVEERRDDKFPISA